MSNASPQQQHALVEALSGWGLQMLVERHKCCGHGIEVETLTEITASVTSYPADCIRTWLDDRSAGRGSACNDPP
jgi:hypothetical protein